MRRSGVISVVLALGLALVTAGCGAAPTADPVTGATPAAVTTAVPTPGTTRSTLTRPPAETSAAEPSTAETSTAETSAPEPGAEDRSIPADLVGLDLEVMPGADRVVALTFDAGANDAAVTSILQTLDDKDVTATFFLTGRWVEVYPDRAREIAARYPVANHSVTHADLTTLSDEAARAEVLDAEATTLDVTGQDPRPWWRFPLGARDDRTIALVNDLGYVSFRWTVDTLGWQGTSGGRSADEVHDRVLDGLQPGEIVLLHVGSHPTDGSMLDAEALPGIIDAIRAEGYAFVTLDAVVPHR